MNSLNKYLLMTVTGISVVSDSLLLPFYPQFFNTTFGIENSAYVGFYLAACVLTSIVGYPLWARLIQRISTLSLLIYTQSAAAVFSVLCFYTDSLTLFWVFSMMMLVLKASYYLIYPYVLSLEKPEHHGATIGLITVIVEFGIIAGAVVGGALLQWLPPKQLFLFMAIGDILQVFLCLWLIKQPLIKSEQRVETADGHSDVEVNAKSDRRRMLLIITFTKFLFFLTAYVGFHFFTSYWSWLTGNNSTTLSGLAFAVPAMMALVGLCCNHLRKHKVNHDQLGYALLFVCIGAFLQAIPQPSWVLLGRIIFGWGLFQAIIRFEVLLFKYSTPQNYAKDYSLSRVAQSLGFLLSTYISGFVLNFYHFPALFFIAGVGLLITIGWSLIYIKQHLSFKFVKSNPLQEQTP